MDQIFGFDFGEEVVGLLAYRRLRLSRASKPMVLLPSRLAIILSRWTKAPPTIKRIFCVLTLIYSWLGCLRPPLGGTLAIGPFDDFQEGLLDSFSGDIAGDGDVAGGLADLIDLIDIDDAHFGSGDVVIGSLDKAEDDVFDIFADIAGFGQGRRIGDGKGNIEDVRQGCGR